MGVEKWIALSRFGVHWCKRVYWDRDLCLSNTHFELCVSVIF